MSVAITFQPLKKNNMSMLHLVVSIDGKATQKSMKLSVYDNPKTRLEKDHNKAVWDKANGIKATQLSQLQLGVGSYVASQQDFLQYFKSLVRERRKNEGSYGNWNSAYKHLVEFCNGKKVRLCDVNEVFLNKFKKYLLEGELTKSGTNLSQNSASSYFLKVKAALNEAYNQKLIMDNPIRRVKVIQPQETTRNFLLQEELVILSKTDCVYPMLKKSFLFSCLTGLRWSDVNKLVWKELVYSEAESRWKIYFRQKKTKGLQYHPISKEAYNLLGERKGDEDRVFKGLKYSAWNNHLLQEWIWKDAGIKKKITFHCSRHTYAIRVLTYTNDHYSLKELLGHQDIKTTQIYAKIIDSKKNSVVDSLPDIGWGLC